MRNIRLLDCTLRDGGFVNDWRFGRGDIITLFERSVSAGIDYIETGFLDEREPFDPDRTMTPDSEAMDKIFAGLDHGNSKIFGMIDYGTCDLSKVKDAKDSVLDGIRVMIKKKTRHEAITFCKELKKKGYLVGAQPVSVTGYTDAEMVELVEEINELHPIAMYIVDTYGLLDRSKLLHIYDLIDRHLLTDIAIGYHAHNNFQQAFSNTVALMEMESERDLVIDGSAYGIGKSAGNCPLELLTTWMNEHEYTHYHTSQVLEMIDTCIMKIYEKNPWGYQMQYFLCASNDCHPKYVQYLLKKKTLSVKSINEILSMIKSEEALAFNQEYIEKLYLEYQNNTISDTADRERLAEALDGKTILVLGPGPSIGNEREKVTDFIASEAPVTMAINFMPERFHLDYIFLSNAKRYMQMSSRLAKLSAENDSRSLKIVATSNVTPARGSFDYNVDYAGLVDMNFEIPDNSLPMLLRLLADTNVKEVVLAGFDGYIPESGRNYADSGMEYEFAANYAIKLNHYTGEVVRTLRDKGMKIRFLTSSKYEV